MSGLDALEYAAAIAILGGVTWAALSLTLPGPRTRRAARREMRALDRAARQPHRHSWPTWVEHQLVEVYAAKASADDSFPIRRNLVQKRTCRECGKVEFRTESY